MLDEWALEEDPQRAKRSVGAIRRQAGGMRELVEALLTLRIARTTFGPEPLWDPSPSCATALRTGNLARFKQPKGGSVHPRRLSAALLFASLVLLAGCGGDGDQPEGQQGGGNDQAQQGGGTTQQEQAGPQIKIAPGTIESVDPEARTLVLQQTRGEPMNFTLGPNAIIQVDGQEAELADLREGQSAQIRYVEREGENRARFVVAFSSGGTTG